MKKLVVLALGAAFAGFAWQSLPSAYEARTPSTAQKSVRGSGVVLGLNQKQGVVTIQHGPLPALNMMAMTMSYAVRDRSQLMSLTVLQQVEFQIVQNGDDYLVTEIK